MGLPLIDCSSKHTLEGLLFINDSVGVAQLYIFVVFNLQIISIIIIQLRKKKDKNADNVFFPLNNER